jgi:hypothetical protein
MMKRPEETRLRYCGHCGWRLEMPVVHVENQVSEHRDEQLAWDEGPVYRLLVCPACNGVLLERLDFHDYLDPVEQELTATTLYPAAPELPKSTPKIVRVEYEAALKARTLDSVAYGIRLGRVLERICEDRGAQGKDLQAKLNELARKGEIPERLNDLAQSLRQLRNAGGHANLGELTESDIPLLDALGRAVLEYVYAAPELVAQAQERYRELRAKEKLRKPSE